MNADGDVVRVASVTLSRRAWTLVLFVALLSVVGLAGISIGAVEIPVAALISGGLTPLQETVFAHIRLPRVVLAGVVGAGLAVAGAAMQGLFRNPLADPGLIGVSSGAALAVGLLIVLGGDFSGILGTYTVSIAAFAGGMAASVLIFRIAATSGVFSVTYLLLAGIAINAMAVAAIGFLIFLSDDQQLRTFTFWTMGSLGGALWSNVIVAASIILPMIFVIVRFARSLNALMLGENEATYLGIDTGRMKKTIVISAAMCVGAGVAVSGIIGFVGLLVPHLVRLMVSSDHRRLIPLSALLGAALLIAADTAARVIVHPAEMPVGVLTSMIGGPFFLWLLVRQFSERVGV